MATITNFEAWLDMADPDDYEEIYALHQAVAGAEDFGLYTCEVNNGRLFVTANHVDDTLMLASESAQKYFLDIVEERYGIKDFGDIEGWYGFNRAMEKDND